MSNVIPLFKEDEEILGVSLKAPISELEDVMKHYIEVADSIGIDIKSPKFLYETSTIMTLMQVNLNGRV